MAERKYSIHFVSTADVSGAATAEVSVQKVGDAAKTAADKLDEFEREWQARLKGLQDKVDAARAGLESSGRDAGEATGRGMGVGLQMAANMHLMNEAWQVGSLIGRVLGEALVSAWEGTLQQRLDAMLAPFVEAAARRMAVTLQAEVQDAMTRVNQQILRDQQAFWLDYQNTQPPNAGDWLLNIEAKASRAAKALAFVGRMQRAEGADREAQIQAEAQDKEDAVNQDTSLGENEKRKRLLIIQQDKEMALLDERNRQREEEVQRAQAQAQLKQSEAQKMREAEAAQMQRAKAAMEAEQLAKQRAAAIEAGGSRADIEAERRQAYQQISQKTGIPLDPNQDEAAALKQARDKRFAAEKAAQEEAAQAEMTRRENAQRAATDDAQTLRKTDLIQRQIQALPQDAPPAQDDPNTARHRIRPGQEQTPEGSADAMRALLGKASIASGNAGLSNDLLNLKSGLADGASAAELKEAAALIQRMEGDSSAAVRQIAQVMRGYVEKQKAELQSVKAELDALRASVESIRP